MNKRYYEHTLSTTREFIEYLRLYGGVDFGEDYREVTGKSAVPEKLYVYVVPSEIRSLLKSWKTSFGSVSRYLPETKL